MNILKFKNSGLFTLIVKSNLFQLTTVVMKGLKFTDNLFSIIFIFFLQNAAVFFLYFHKRHNAYGTYCSQPDNSIDIK